MKPAEFWAETPAELTDWIGTVSEFKAKRDAIQAWQIANLVRIGHHAPKKFPDLKKLLEPSAPEKPLTKAQREVQLMLSGQIKIDPATLPPWALKESKVKK
jgi:hypothetical protein